MALEIPIFPLSGVVHFPATELRLHIFEPRYRQLINDLEQLPESERHLGMVVPKPREVGDEASAPAVFPTGTAARLTEIEALPDGRFNIRLHGEFRFRVESERPSPHPYRMAAVQEVVEPPISVDAPEIRNLIRGLGRSVARVGAQMKNDFPLTPEQAIHLAEGGHLEILVNTLGAGLDLPIARKLQLLSSPLPQRGATLLAWLRDRERVLDLLRPYRALAGRPGDN